MIERLGKKGSFVVAVAVVMLVLTGLCIYYLESKPWTAMAFLYASLPIGGIVEYPKLKEELAEEG